VGRRKATLVEFEVRRAGALLERFHSDTDAHSERACVALLRRRAVALHVPVEEVSLVAKDYRGRIREYRAP
jgi:hypothetical protein